MASRKILFEYDIPDMKIRQKDNLKSDYKIEDDIFD